MAQNLSSLSLNPSSIRAATHTHFKYPSMVGFLEGDQGGGAGATLDHVL